MTVYTTKPAINLREELASLRNQGGYSEQQFYFDGLVTNGTFDTDTNWTKGTGWTIGTGVASFAGGGTAPLSQNVGLVKGTAYQLAYTVSGRTAGTIYPVLGGNVNGTTRTSNGTFTQVIVSGSNANLYFQQDTNFVGSIDNVSVYETDGTNVVHRLPKGWKPKDFYEDGLLQREGAANDYTVIYDGFDYYIKPAVAPSATTQTCVIGVRA